VKEKIIKLIENYLEEILKGLKVEASFRIEEEGKTFFVNLETSTAGVLIGSHGRTLFALRWILSLIVYRHVEEWPRIVLDVNGYRQKRERALKKMALSTAQRVRLSGQEQALPPMPSEERKIVHLTLSGDSEVTTESRGEGEERRVVIKPKK